MALSSWRGFVFKHVNKVRHRFLMLKFVPPKDSEWARRFGTWGANQCGHVMDWACKPETDAQVEHLNNLRERVDSIVEETKALQAEAGDPEDPEYADRLVSSCLDILEQQTVGSMSMTPREEAAFRLVHTLLYEKETK